MAILNLGSINVDTVYQVREFPKPGETISAISRVQGLGGKGLNQSVAIARAGGEVHHFGAIGIGDRWIINEMSKSGVECGLVQLRAEATTGQAMVLLNASGENSIVLHPGANHSVEESEIRAAISTMKKDDWFLIQNETNGLSFAVDCARSQGLRIALSAAPFSAEMLLPLLSKTDLVVLNDVEYSQLEAAATAAEIKLDATSLLITKGKDGAEYRGSGPVIQIDAFEVTPVDTTGAGDTFLGYFLACVDGGSSIPEALSLASAAAAIQVTRLGAANAIPFRNEVDQFLRTHPHIYRSTLRRGHNTHPIPP